MLRFTIIECFIVLLSIITINEIIAQTNHNQTLTFVDPFGEFSIDYPSDWEAIAPGHRFEEGNLDLIIQKPDRKQGYIEIRHEEINTEIKKSNDESSLPFSRLTNNSLEYLLSALFKEYITKLNLHNFQYIQKFYFDRYLILDMNSSSILYSFEKDNRVFYGLYTVAKNDYNLITILYIASTDYFDNNLPKLETMIHSLKFKL